MAVFTFSIKHTLWNNTNTKAALVKHHVLSHAYYSYLVIINSFSRSNLRNTEILGSLNLRV